MKTLLAMLAAGAILAVPAAATAKPRHHHHARVVYAQRQIACTQYGCMQVPPGCHPETGRTPSGLPSGFDVVTCGYNTLYGNR
jgi:hypothetical protein